MLRIALAVAFFLPTARAGDDESHRVHPLHRRFVVDALKTGNPDLRFDERDYRELYDAVVSIKAPGARYLVFSWMAKFKEDPGVKLHPRAVTGASRMADVPGDYRGDPATEFYRTIEVDNSWRHSDPRRGAYVKDFENRVTGRGILSDEEIVAEMRRVEEKRYWIIKRKTVAPNVRIYAEACARSSVKDDECLRRVEAYEKREVAKLLDAGERPAGPTQDEPVTVRDETPADGVAEEGTRSDIKTGETHSSRPDHSPRETVSEVQTDLGMEAVPKEEPQADLDESGGTKGDQDVGSEGGEVREDAGAGEVVADDGSVVPGETDGAPTHAPLDPEFTALYVQDNPNDSTGRFEHGRALAKRGDHRAAVPEFDKAAELGEPGPWVHVAKAHSALQAGDHPTALLASRAALQRDPGNKTAVALEKLAKTQVPAGEVSSVLKKLGRGKGLGEDGGFAGAGPAGKLAGLAGTGTGGRIPGGASSAKRARKLVEEAARALALKDYASAERLAGKAVKLNPRSAQSHTLLALALSRQGKFMEALKHAERAVVLSPDDPVVRLNRAKLLNRLKRFKRALSDAQFASRKLPRNAHTWAMIAAAQAGLGNRGEALEALRRAAALGGQYKELFEAAQKASNEQLLALLFDDDVLFAEDKVPDGAFVIRLDKGTLAVIPLALAAFILLALGIFRVLGPRTGRTPLPVPSAGGAPERRKKLGKQFELGPVLGSGGMGVVYEGRDSALGRLVAIKKMREELREDAGLRERFLQEARTVAKLKHPGIVEIYSVLEEGGDIYLVFEHVQGRTLADILEEKGRLSFDQALNVLVDACEAVAHAHGQKVVHRDLKPSNIMIDEEGNVKVMDFGVARAAKDAISKLTPGTVAGTPAYMAPEQEQGTSGRRSDVFALGVCFFEMLTGKLPFAGQGAVMQANKMRGIRVPLPQGQVLELPLGLESLLNKALDPDLRKRYLTPVALADAAGKLRDALPGKR